MLNLFEQQATDIDSQIKYWELVRKQNVILFYARKEGHTRLGLQPTPVASVSEYLAKQAIHMLILLKSLKQSPFGSERWTLTDTSTELLNTPPKNCFKKQGYTVTVYFDNEESNSFPYTNWDHIYYQDLQDKWHKVKGEVDYNGLFYKEHTGDIVYFQLFDPDSQRYGSSGQWTVKFKQTTISAPVTSSSRRSSAVSGEATKYTTSNASQRFGGSQTRSPGPSSPSSSSDIQLRRRREGESRSGDTEPDGGTPRKRRRHSPEQEFSPTPEEVGRRHRSVARTGLTRIQRLQEEARDPPIIIVTGCANTLKCWRNRFKKHTHLYKCSTSVFKWVTGDCTGIQQSRLLIAFTDNTQRQRFFSNINLPRHSTYAFGQLNSL